MSGDEAHLLLAEAVEWLRDFTEPQTGYGHFPGGDPRTFSPDPECSTEEEREAHRCACEAWTAAESSGTPSDALPGPHLPIVDGAVTLPEAAVVESGVLTKDAEGRIVGHVTLAGFGLGTYSYVNEAAASLVARSDALISDDGSR